MESSVHETVNILSTNCIKILVGIFHDVFSNISSNNINFTNGLLLV